ncbi:unnamed protein product [Linum trigynum]|uniref:Uncharacterized protein n=1 Tax=Linum trigynum TaxID=586398 RepID=A0AAV2FS48_9ROSI
MDAAVAAGCSMQQVVLGKYEMGSEGERRGKWRGDWREAAGLRLEGEAAGRLKGGGVVAAAVLCGSGAAARL